MAGVLRALGVLGATVLAALVLAPAALAAPTNDSFTAPYPVDTASGIPVRCCPLQDGTPMTTFDATVEPGEPLTPGNGFCMVGTTQITMVKTTWYRVIGNGGTMSIDTADSNFDTVLAAYFSPTPSLTDPLPCSDDANGTQQSALSFQTEAGRAYLIQVGGCNACAGSIGSSGNLVMHLSATAPPPAPAPPAPPAPPPVVIAPPDTDGDGIPNARDACPTIKPTRDANNDGCQDKPIRILSDLKYDGSFIRRGGAVRGIALSRVRLTRVPVGARVSVSCAGCRRAAGGGGTQRFTRFSFTAKKGGTQTMGRLNRLLLLRGRQVIVVVTSPDHLGRRVVVKMGTRRDAVTLSCLAPGTTATRVACSTGS
jgi:hypothetical protein